MLYLVLLLATLAVQGGSLQVAPWWLTPAAIVLAERVWTVRREGPRAVLVAALFLPEFAYDWLRQFAWLHAALNAISGAEHKWVAT
jgi:biofilm PGA synthesis N-glycosyltransferase PgaC